MAVISPLKTSTGQTIVFGTQVAPKAGQVLATPATPATPTPVRAPTPTTRINSPTPTNTPTSITGTGAVGPLAAPKSITGTGAVGPIPVKPISTPTTVVSSKPAAQQIQNAQNVVNAGNLTQSQADIRDTADMQDPTLKFLGGSGKPNPNYVAPVVAPPTPPTPLTIDQQIAGEPSSGNQFAWNTVTGVKQEVPNGPLPPGFSSQDPTTRKDVVDTAVVDDAGTTFKKFSDGTYGRFDGSGNYSQASAEAFAGAKDIVALREKVKSIQNGTFVLPPNQQAQITALQTQTADQIRKTQLENDALTGGMTAAQNMNGMGNNQIGQGAIAKTVLDGLDRIKVLQDDLAGKIATMTDGFQKDDMALLKDSYTQYLTLQKDLQTEIDRDKDALAAQKVKDDTIVANYGSKAALIYTNAGIDGTEKTIAEINDKINKSEAQLSAYATAIRPNKDVTNVYDPIINNTPGAVYQDALTYVHVGPTALSGMGFGSAEQVKNYRSAVKAQGAAITDLLGIDEFQARALFRADSAAATQNVERLARVESITNSIINQFPRLASLADEVKAAGIQITESDIQDIQANILRKFGNTPAAAFIELIQTIRADYSANNSALAGSRGGEFFTKIATDAIPIGLTGDQYNAIKDQMVLSTNNIRDGVNKEITNLIGTSGGVPNTISTGTAGTGTIQSGDTMDAIATKLGTTVAELQRLNPGMDPNNLTVGGTMNLPSSSSSSSSSGAGAY